MKNIKLYVHGWHGPWSWIDYLYEHRDINYFTGVELTDNIEESDVVFKSGTSNKNEYIDKIKNLNNKPIVIQHILDFADWHGYGPKMRSISEHMKLVMIADKITVNSNIVRKQTKEYFNIESEVFSDPSQVNERDYENYNTTIKNKQFISFCRLSDSGKAIDIAIDAFANSKLFDDGWEYLLIGSELPPHSNLPDGCRYLGLLDKHDLFKTIAESYCTIQPSYGEGLGLPAIESSLLGTLFLTRNVEPMKSMWNCNSNVPEWLSSRIMFDDNGDLVSKMIKISKHHNYVPFQADAIRILRNNVFIHYRDISIARLFQMALNAFRKEKNK